MGNVPTGGVVIDITPLNSNDPGRAWGYARRGWWRKRIYGGKELWLVPNEVRGLPLFPDDY